MHRGAEPIALLGHRLQPRFEPADELGGLFALGGAQQRRHQVGLERSDLADGGGVLLLEQT